MYSPFSTNFFNIGYSTQYHLFLHDLEAENNTSKISTSTVLFVVLQFLMSITKREVPKKGTPTLKSILNI